MGAVLEPAPGLAVAVVELDRVTVLVGKVAGREVATVVSAQDIGSIAKGRKPRPNSASFEMLKGGDYWRVWINKGGTNYIINLPPAA